MDLKNHSLQKETNDGFSYVVETIYFRTFGMVSKKVSVRMAITTLALTILKNNWKNLLSFSPRFYFQIKPVNY